MTAGFQRPTFVLEKELARLERAVERASERRRAIPVGSSRARVTTANARWATACEARDRVEAELRLRRQTGA